MLVSCIDCREFDTAAAGIASEYLALVECDSFVATFMSLEQRSYFLFLFDVSQWF